MTKKELMIKAHKMTKEIKEEYPAVDYKFQLGLCMSYLLKGDVKMVELKGTEKQIAWAESIRKEALELLEKYETVKTNVIEREIAWCGDKAIETEIVKIYKKEERFEEAQKALLDVKKLIENEESAKFFIENRAQALVSNEQIFITIAKKHNCKSSFLRLRKAFEEDVIKINL